MFQSLDIQRYEHNICRYIYKLTDSDFEIEIVGGDDGGTGGFEVLTAIAIAREYEKRNLNVAANLALYYKWFGCLKLDNIIHYNQKYQWKLSQEFYGKYLADIKKYIALI